MLPHQVLAGADVFLVPLLPFPGRLLDKALTGHYRTAAGQNLPHGFLISRADVAHLMLSVVEQPSTIQQTIGVAY